MGVSNPIVPPPTVSLTAEQIDAMIEAGVQRALASKKSSWSWAKIRGNKYFVTATTLLSGAVAGQAYEAIKAGGFVWNTKSIEAMIGSALLTTVSGLYHLYIEPKPPGAS